MDSGQSARSDTEGTTQTITKLCISMGPCLSSSCFLRDISSPKQHSYNSLLFISGGGEGFCSAPCPARLHLVPKRSPYFPTLLVFPFLRQRGLVDTPPGIQFGFVRQQSEAESRLTPTACSCLTEGQRRWPQTWGCPESGYFGSSAQT